MKTTTPKRAMLRSTKDLIGYPIDATDGGIGRVKDLLIDDEKLAVRYLVADTGNWLSEHKVLISPRHLDEPDLGRIGNHLPVKLTKAQVEACPPLDDAAPISRQYEMEYARHYDQPLYWAGDALWGLHGTPAVLPPQPPAMTDELRRSAAEIEENHLRSFKEVKTYAIAATDGHIGTVDEFIVECDSWGLRFLVIDTNHWLPGGKVLIGIDWLKGFNWSDASAEVNLSKEQIKNAPKFDHSKGVNEDYAREVYDYYGKPVSASEPPLVTPY